MAVPSSSPSSPAERFAAAKARAQRERKLQASELGRFREAVGFDLDGFQLRACEALEAGRGVLVAAPTGAGKTVVGEFAVHLALASGRKAFYTTPIKALSNQKHAELAERFGSEQVGLLTGDTSVNGDAPVVVMTTEVLRNMLYAGSPALDGLAHVVMDEVHYLADRSRGAVWEEVIIHLPDDVLITSLSATVSNAEEFGDWLATVRGAVDVVVSEHRPVPLWQHVMVGTRVVDLFTEREAGHSGGRPVPSRRGTAPAEPSTQLEVNPELVRMSREDVHRGGGPGGRGGRAHPGRRPPRGGQRSPAVRARVHAASRAEVLAELEEAHLLPAILFVFSRNGCDAAVRQCVSAGVRLTTDAERREIRAVVEERCAALPDVDLAVLGYWDWLDGLSRGVAAHHAGMLPTFKEVVEDLFARGLVKAVFATETLALGINMPARCVVIEKLVKFNGESHVDVTPGEYTQLTGRAGRRGIDVEGHAVVLWQPGLDAEGVAGLASTRTYPLRSSFRPTYNMAVNLVAQVGRARAREVLETSFAQFQADRGVVGLARQARTQSEGLAGYAEAMTCHLGDFSEYAALRRRIGELEGEGARRRRRGPVEELSLRGAEARQKGGVTDQRRPLRDDQVAAEVNRLRRQMRQHPCHGCPDREDHARWAERWERLRKEHEGVLARIESRTGTIARTFDRVCDLLVELGYLEPTGPQQDGEERPGELPGELRVTPAGQVLRRVYAEKDLLVAECLRSGAWAALDAAGLATVLSTIVYEARREEGPPAAHTPGGHAVSQALSATVRAWSQLSDAEEAHHLRATGEPDLGLVWPVHRWCRGASLDAVLDAARGPVDLAAGDFVRWARQLLDLLDQVVVVASRAGTDEDDALARTARQAIGLVDRGVVTYSAGSAARTA
ncbi:DEAD/DEAH box helicase [Streptomyces sp. NP160]|uniref:DEAD/DEAH box helicase n=1 Tax=Streptomyces sp. NP160 TaxID=2586637 RepID=UPI001119CADF|nr:DEAD/DEAH box helicase [Streptomyces sp. NP160]TNM70180.1 DEAD/DEAH box helicase [Streptomyces sp. NP160]